jgi:hypothetical protein
MAALLMRVEATDKDPVFELSYDAAYEPEMLAISIFPSEPCDHAECFLAWDKVQELSAQLLNWLEVHGTESQD